MTTGEARVSETEEMVFSADLTPDNLPEELQKPTLNHIKLEEETKKAVVESRFAGLKKSLRRKSVSIL